jgi:transcription-repair coupling factor (superfamily II helicase)
LYCQLLENSVRRLRNQPLRTPLDVTVDLPFRAFLPRDYVPSRRLQIEVYRRLSRLRRAERLDDFRQELRDRFGVPPESVEWLLRLTELRLLAARWQIATVHLEEHDVVLGYRSARQAKRLAERSCGRLRIVNATQAYFRLEPAETTPDAMYAVVKDLLRYPTRPV